MGDVETTSVDEPADDLFGRWLAHREQADEPAAKPEPRRPRAASTLAIEPPSSFGSARPSDPGTGVDPEVRELDRVAPPGFEPVLMRSVRKKAEAKQADAAREGRRLFGLARSRPAAPDQATEPAEALGQAVPVPAVDVPEAPADPPAPTRAVEDVIAAAMAARTTPPPAPAKVAAPTARNQPAASAPEPAPTPEPVPTPTPEPSPTPEPTPTPGPTPEPEPTPTPEPTPEPEPTPPPQPTPEPEPSPAPQAAAPRVQASASEAWRSFTEPVEAPEFFDPVPLTADPESTEVAKARSLSLRKSLPARKTRDEKPPREARQARVRREPRPSSRTWDEDGPSEADAVRTLIATARQRRATAPAASPTVTATAVEEVAPAIPEDEPAVVSTYAPLPPAAPEMPSVYEFAPRLTSRRILNATLLCGLAATCLLAYSYYEDGGEVTKGMTAIVGLTTLLVWAARAGSAPTTLTVRNGQLEVRRQGSRFVFDLASTYTPVKVVGEPGKRGWKVLFLRRGMRPFAVDASMADPHEFMRVLRFFRPVEEPKKRR